ncbi:hypothetical protein GLOIN_2v1790954 [Rhizophagus clarus]|uniref:Uncharacterized protein n=1 Tax=Rhizophagus clarus TaxID=94130 RepID=A0A8H3LPQ9_9GLOM|nr:hypothetical protein GLOIN_2v1790954 [Rhizophagus clarus]
MSNVHTLKDIEDKGAVGGLLGKQIPPGRWLGSNRESELEKALRGSIKTASDIANDYKELQDKEATLAQKASSLDKIKILSLEAKISELEGKLEDLKVEQEDFLLHTSFFDSDVVEEITGTPGKQKDSKLLDWIDDNLKSLVYELGFENKVKEIEKKITKEDLLEVLQYALLKRNSLLQEANLKGSANACLAK